MTHSEWMDRVLYLPRFLRDFHDQKAIFKWMVWGKIGNLKATDPERVRYVEDLKFDTAQVFVIDYFLWFMAQCGWTLQRSRRKFDFADIEATVAEYMERLRERQNAELQAYLDGKRQQTGEAIAKALEGGR